MAFRWQIALAVIAWSQHVCANHQSATVEVPDPTYHKDADHVTPAMSRNISIVGDSFVVDGKPVRLVSGSLHYFRVPAAKWRDRLSKLKAAGLNAVATYVEWSFHEPEERRYDFEGDRDVVQFVKLAAEEGLYVLLRPGPYICAERDLGGLPYWLLSKYPHIQLRTTDKDFISETKIWMEKLFGYMKPLLYANGGPIILVQVENEYGSYGSELAYMESVRDVLRLHVDSAALLYTTDGFWQQAIERGHAPDTLTTVDFGTGTNPTNAFAPLRRFMPSGPLMNSEFYPGWLTHWSEPLQQITTESVVETFRKMLNLNASVNFYMFFGGTNFEFTAGANYGMGYMPDITSYDYDAPLSEAGDPTPKYNAIRDVLEEFYPETKLILRPVASEKGAYGTIKLKPFLELLSKEGRSSLGVSYPAVAGASLPTFEVLRQRAGLLLYETTIPGMSATESNADGTNWRFLHVDQPHDRVYVYVNGTLQGTLSRMHKLFSLMLVAQENDTLSLLVETQGRINYGNKLHDFKGILSDVTLDGKTLAGQWSVLGYPLENVSDLKSPISDDDEGPTLLKGPVMYEANFTLPAGEEPKDTFLDTTAWGKGYVWINGMNLGRYWPSLGPQVTLYVPSCWLHSTKPNLLRILELETPRTDLTIKLIDHPILGNTRSEGISVKDLGDNLG